MGRPAVALFPLVPMSRPYWGPAGSFITVHLHFFLHGDERDFNFPLITKCWKFQQWIFMIMMMIIGRLNFLIANRDLVMTRQC